MSGAETYVTGWKPQSSRPGTNNWGTHEAAENSGTARRYRPLNDLKGFLRYPGKFNTNVKTEISSMEFGVRPF